MGIFQPLIPTTVESTFVMSFNVGDLTEGQDSYPTMSTSSMAPISGLAFSAEETQYVYDSFQIPNNYVVGSDVGVGVHYFVSTTQTGTKNCAWMLNYQTFNDSDNIHAKVTTTTGVLFELNSDELADTYRKASFALSATASGNPLNKDTFLSFSISRACGCVSDTMADDAILTLLTFEFLVEVPNG